MKRNLKKERQNIAKERMEVLFEKAKENTSYSKRYITLARKISEKYNKPIPREYRRLFCKVCNSLHNSENTRIRTRDGHMVYTCLKCKQISRFVIK